MIVCRCTHKFRDKNNNIKGYRLSDMNGQSIDLKPEQLKMAIFQKQLNVVNLKLTSDSRLIDCSEETNIEALKLIDEYNRTPEMLKQRYAKYIKIIEHINKRILQINKKRNLPGEDGKYGYADNVDGVNIYVLVDELNEELKENNLIYTKITDMKIPGNMYDNKRVEIRLYLNNIEEIVLWLEVHMGGYRYSETHNSFGQYNYRMYSGGWQNEGLNEWDAYYAEVKKAFLENMNAAVDKSKKSLDKVDIRSRSDQNFDNNEDLIYRLAFVKVLDDYKTVMQCIDKVLLPLLRGK